MNYSGNGNVSSLAGRKRNYQGDYSELKPSRVLHLRELPGHTLECDVLEVFSRAGRVKYVSMIPDSHQALVEFYDLEAAEEMVQKYRDSGIALPNGSIIKLNFSTSTSISLRSVDDVDQAESPILGLTVYRAHYPIHAELIHKIVSQYGKPRKILIIRKKNIVAFVEFDSIQEAKQVKMRLNGADIYSSCCSLKVDFAPHRPLRIARNDHEQWDEQLEAMGQPMRGPPPGIAARNLPLSLLGASGIRDLSQATIDTINNRGGFGSNIPATLRISSIGGIVGAQSPVVMIYGFNMEEVNCDRVFNIACLYGNVVRVKFLHSKEGSCMVQMGDEIAAQNLIDNFTGTYLFGNRILIHPGKQAHLQPVMSPYNLPDGTQSYKEFANSPLNRFITREKASRNRICRPVPTLHFWNCPPTLTEEDVRDYFDHPSIRKPERVVMFHQSDKSSSGLLEWNSTEEATNALAVTNHKVIHSDSGRDLPPWYMKLCYSLASSKSRNSGGGTNVNVMGPNSMFVN
jgi:heterogeneous nuclear ribonucleoprotein L